MGQDAAAAPLERRSRARWECEAPQGPNTQQTGCPGFWELWVTHTEGCLGEGLPQPSGRPCAPCGLAISGGDRLLVYL